MRETSGRGGWKPELMLAPTPLGKAGRKGMHKASIGGRFLGVRDKAGREARRQRDADCCPNPPLTGRRAVMDGSARASWSRPQGDANPVANSTFHSQLVPLFHLPSTLRGSGTSGFTALDPTNIIYKTLFCITDTVHWYSGADFAWQMQEWMENNSRSCWRTYDES